MYLIIIINFFVNKSTSLKKFVYLYSTTVQLVIIVIWGISVSIAPHTGPTWGLNQPTMPCHHSKQTGSPNGDSQKHSSHKTHHNLESKTRMLCIHRQMKTMKNYRIEPLPHKCLYLLIIDIKTSSFPVV